MVAPGKRSLYYGQLARMISSGISMIEIFTLLEGKGLGSELAKASHRFKDDLIDGKSLQDSLEQQQSTFSPFERGLLQVGIESGRLSEQCRLLEQWFHRVHQFHQKFKAEMTFPMILAPLAWLIPKANIFVTDGPSGYFWQAVYPLLAVLAGVLVLYLLLDWKYGEAGVEQAIGIHLPYVGRAIRKLLIARFFRAFSSTLEAGLPLFQAIPLALEGAGRGFLQRPIDLAMKEVENGKTLSQGFTLHAPFPPEVLQLLSTGEKTGNFPEMAGKAADMLEEEAEASLKVAFRVFSLAFYLCVVGYIAYQVISSWAAQYAAIDELK